NLRVLPRDGAPGVSGWVMRIRRGPNLLGTLVRVVSLDGVGEQGLVLAPAEGDGVVVANEALAILQDALVAAGLTTTERDAFVAAWSDALFGVVTRSDAQRGSGSGRGMPGGTEGDVSAGVSGRGSTVGVGGIGLTGGAQDPPRHPLGSVADAVVYVLPQASVDALIPLELEPAPRELRRVFLARVDASGPRPPSLHAAPPEVRGALPVEVVRRVVRRSFSPLRRCLADNHETTSFQLELRVLTTGDVAQVTVEGEHLSDGERGCLVGVARQLRFPASETLNTIAQRMTLQR
ncbi:MAG: hypothetical protein KC668_28625, partial [Myxococcales bacterium]|nr:hypothetical protein [Myxococcales bacterium]